jgi:hypothetical protein
MSKLLPSVVVIDVAVVPSAVMGASCAIADAGNKHKETRANIALCNSALEDL